MSEAIVKTLTAEVRCLMVGNRQVTLSVYRQLDVVDADAIEPFGRVSDSRNAVHASTVYVVGRKTVDGMLAKSECSPVYWPETVAPRIEDFFRTGPFKNWSKDEKDWYFVKDPEEKAKAKTRYNKLQALPERPTHAHILTRNGLHQWWRMPRDETHFTNDQEQALVDEQIPPGGWTFRSYEIKKQAIDFATKDMDAYEAHCRFYKSWQDLHLIVLAGLR